MMIDNYLHDKLRQEKHFIEIFFYQKSSDYLPKALLPDEIPVE
jgi:hypothetical protein